MAEIDIKQAVKDGALATFSFYRDDQLWYKTAGGVEFPVPLTDVGNATFGATEKALLLMRYMRKWNAHLAAAKEAQRSKEGPTKGTSK